MRFPLGKCILHYLGSFREEPACEVNILAITLRQKPHFEAFDEVTKVNVLVDGSERQVSPSRYFRYMADKMDYMCPLMSAILMYEVFRKEAEIEKMYQTFLTNQNFKEKK